MNMLNIEIEIELKEIKEFIIFFKERYGYDFSNYAFSSFKRRLQRILHVYHLKNLAELQQKLIKNELDPEKIVENITVNTTEMFRDPAFWKKMRNTILPGIFSSKKGNVKIWHAACSSGEEVYSMSIILSELNLLDRADILATDINEEVIEKARKGVYPKSGLKTAISNYEKTADSPQSLFKSYYQEINEYQFQLDNNLISNVKFNKFDLVRDEQKETFDLILIRNVMIYFNFELQEKVISEMVKSLVTGGYLAIGAKESIAWSRSAEHFKLIDVEDKIYKRIK